MKTKILIILAMMACSLEAQDNPSGFAALRGRYLGQKPPGTTPEIFAPGIVSTGLDEAVIAFTPDGTECFWTIMFSGLETIVTSKIQNGHWTEPEVASFAGQYYDGWPAVQPDGTRLFFHSSRRVPKNSAGITARFNIWYVERTPQGWSEPLIVDTPVNGSENATCPSVTMDGTLYFSKRFKDTGEKICRSKFVQGKYRELEILPSSVNTVKDNFHAFVSPDETYLIMPAHGRKDAIGGGWNYYVSFREGDNSWSELTNLGSPLNSALCMGIPCISSDGKYLFYQVVAPGSLVVTLGRRYSLRELIDRQIRNPAPNCTDIYWVDAAFIQDLRPKRGK